MKFIKKNYEYFLFALIFIGCAFFYTKTVNKIENLKKVDYFLSDSIGKLNAEIYYLQELASLNLIEQNRNLPENLYAYKMNGEEKNDSVNFPLLLKKGKKKLIIRYTEIGCNSCSDSTLRLIRNNKNLLNQFEIIVLVDFTDYKSYIKWAKILEIEEKVLWMKKGNLPFDIEKENSSYLFLFTEEKSASSFFIPNSLFIKYLHGYLNNLHLYK